MSKITIPPAALEAGAEAFLECDRSPACSFEDALRAAFLAMIEKWPEMKTETTFWSNADGAGCGRHVLSLPLPQQENSDAKR